jgi:MerR family mercuric resistance operon transcriptional regulator
VAKSRTIGKLAAEVGVSVETVRFYERSGVLQQPADPEHGWRKYGEDALVTLRYVREARRLGLTVADIGHLRVLTSGPQPDFCQGVRDTVEARIRIIGERINELERLRQGLSEWLGACRARSPDMTCPTYETLRQSRERNASNDSRDTLHGARKSHHPE